MKSTVLMIAALLVSSSALANLTLTTKNTTVRAPIPGMKNTVGYMSLVNTGDEAVVLTSASSDGAKKVEFHNHEMKDGVMRMFKVDSVEIKPDETVTFESGGLHLMFLSVEPSLSTAKLIDVTFYTESNESFTVPFDVQSIKVKHHH